MNKLLLSLSTGLLLLTGVRTASASSVLPLSLEQQVDLSTAVFRGTVLQVSPFIDETDDLVYTLTSIRVDEAVKGKFPDVVKVVHRGGRFGNRDEFIGLSPQFNRGGEYLVFLTRRADGQLNCTQGSASAMPLTRATATRGAGALIPSDQALLNNAHALAAQHPDAGGDVTDQAGVAGTRVPTGLLITNGMSTRFIQQDRGEPIPYLVDATSLPTGITLATASNAVRQALNAWTAVTSLKFVFEGYQNFVAGADAINAGDQRLRIQLHDNFNRINSPSVLGIGGRYGRTIGLPTVGWELGGAVGTNNFGLSLSGFVVLERTNAALQNAQTLAEVLCHEIGHALSMAHSSEVPTSNALLTNSIMFYQAHSDGRGATLGAYDPPVIQQAYPSDNTPPWAYDRYMDITTMSGGFPNLPGINEIEMRGYDLQSTNLTFQTTNVDVGSGSFVIAGKLLKFQPAAFYNAPPVDIGAGEYYDWLVARFSDGTNASPPFSVVTTSLNPDSGTVDGIPDNWMITYFGSSIPSSGNKSRAIDDADNDGMINLQEYRAGMIPTDATSGQRVTFIAPNTVQFQAKPYQLYELLGSTDLTNWVRVVPPVSPTTTTGAFTEVTNGGPRQFYRVVKVP